MRREKRSASAFMLQFADDFEQLLGGSDPDNEIAMTAFRLLTMDLLELFKVMNEGTINVLGMNVT